MKRTYLGLCLLALTLTACEFSLAGDITPPPEAVISDEATLLPVAPPISTPDLTRGAEIYSNRCAPCHGKTGLGDGEQAAQLPFFPSAIGDPDLARAVSPEDWFRIVSYGRLPRTMPPFAAALSEQERWDVLSYVYSLGWDAETLTRGEQIYDANKAEIDAALIGTSPIAIDISLIEALPLPVEDAQALTAYLQAQALGSESITEQLSEGGGDLDEESVATLGRFTGRVVYGSGEQLPAGLQARLYGFDHTDQVISETSPVTSDGNFSFDEISIANGRIFFVQVDYKELSFFSEFLTVDGQEGTNGLDVPIYDSTSDISMLVAERVQLFFDFPRQGVVRVVESVTISNLGDKAVAPDENGQPVLHFTLPEQAGNLMFQEGELGDRYIADETGFSDTRAVLPGVHSVELFFAYELPYDGSMDFPIHFDLPTKTVVVLLPTNFDVESEKLRSQDQEDFNGVTYMAYSAGVAYSRGDELSFQFSGAHPLGASRILQDDNLLIGLASLTAAVGFAWLWLRSLPASKLSGTDRVLAEITDLDALYKHGKIAKTSYSKKRSALKDSLRRELGKKK